VRLARWLWRVGQRSSFRSGLVAGVGIVVGAVLPTCTVCYPSTPTPKENERLGELFERGFEDLADGRSIARASSRDRWPP
jgi:hypothetical protein